MNQLQLSFAGLVHDHRTGSYTTQADRRHILHAMGAELYALGFTPATVEQLRPKHIDAWVDHWQAKELSAATMKNRLSCLRWALEKVNRLSIIPASNDRLGIARRRYVTQVDKSRTLDERLQAIDCPFLRGSLRLQAAFGLRRETSLKIRVAEAWQGDRLVLKGSWTKGKVPHEVPIETDEQRLLLRQVRLLVGNASLIPAHLRYVDQLRKYQYQTAKAGFDKLHGLRHAYAQRKYEALTGWPAPVKGGPRQFELGEEERARDKQARLEIAKELGHRRRQITNVYLGT